LHDQVLGISALQLNLRAQAAEPLQLTQRTTARLFIRELFAAES
jgi:hypothetical protein